MSTFKGSRSVEDGGGWGGLVPSKRDKIETQDDRDIDMLSSALEAALRWPYDPTIKEHAANPGNIPAEFDDRYKMDMYDIRAGLRVIEKRRRREG